MKPSCAEMRFAPLVIIALALAFGCKSSEKLPEKVSQTLSGAPAPAKNDQFKKASRLAIKRATDPDSAKISLTAKPTTIEAMLKVVRPDDLAADISTESYQNKRVGPFETTDWQLDTTITEVVKRSDGDYYMVVEDGKGHRTVVEVPDPSLCVGSNRLQEITAARKAIEEKFHPNAEPKKTHTKARIEGFGFFGFARSRNGQPPGNGARIMPGLKVEWR